MSENREKWGSRIGVILAVAGSAVGLGNFLRFPTKAVLNGGGAFLIPYFVALILLGIPLMWVEWTLGRYGGRYGHGTAPGVFDKLGKSKVFKYLGVLGTLIPFMVLIYYMYIESWTLGYAFFSFTGELFKETSQESMKGFLNSYQGLSDGSTFTTAIIFFAITFFTNFYFIYKGLQGGIEKLSKIGMPILVIIAIILAVRVLTLGTPDPSAPDQSINNALGFFWNPDFSQLTNAKVWLEAAGQIFFTLSVGMGMIITYASYLSDKDDIALSGLSSCSINEFCEVILGGSIVVPAVFVFFGAVGALSIAQTGTFNVGFVTMPLIFEKMPLGFLFSGLWFILLFIAGITSSVSMIQPIMSFLEDEFGISRKKATIGLGIISFLATLPAIFFLQHGFLDELDFWNATFFVVVFGTVEILIFVFVMGINKGWDEIHIGSIMRIPKFYKYIIKYVTPVYLVGMLVVWFYQSFLPIILLEGVSDIDKPYIWGARGMILLFILINAYLVYLAWKKHRKEEEVKL
ncbi:MAG: sodium-dependent transporter [Ignavibacteria bacterium]|nr:sodium-dependent transporter [Ignavibacteria bacterium]